MGIIQRQSIQSTFIILIGFIIGAVNLLILFPAFFSQTEIGMTRALMDISLTLATLATLGTLPVIYKFYPFYKDFTTREKNDLPFLTAMVSLAGFLLVLLAGYVFQDYIIRKLGKSPEFARYFYIVYPFTFFFLAFIWMEAFAWGLKKTTLTNFLKETLVRISVTVLILLFASRVIGIKKFMELYGFIYLVPVLWLFLSLKKSGDWKLNVMPPGKVSQRLGKRMISFGIFIFCSQFLNVLSRTSDTIFAVGFQGLPQAGIFAIATYMVTVMEIPQRSLNTISIPVLADAWKNRDMKNISDIYKKSVSNMLVIGAGMFCLLLLNVPYLVDLLNHFGKKNLDDYSIIVQIVLIMGLARVIDLGTGVNSQIIITSNYWKFDFLTNILFTLVSLPLNFILIKKMGLMGLAYANLISLIVYNLVRFIFLYKKFGLQPYTNKSFLTLVFAAVCYFITSLVLTGFSWYTSIILNTVIFCLLFFPLAYFFRLAPEINGVIDGFLKNIPGLKRKNK
jgi:O-antigen/teichoic acid export membrane protein